jgi:pyruvate/2-oxoglutarate dehydrogenase complex dihydrolipoamide dehydrogenase (E3) component
MLQAETLLTTVGRDAGVLGLKLEAAGVQFSLKGIAVDNLQRTTASNIYAAGDVCGPIQLAAMAEYQALNAVNNMFFPVKRLFDPDHHLSVIFSDPPLARTGLTEAEAREQFGESVRVYRMEYAAIRRARIDGNVEGLAKIITSGDGRVIGANILGAHADEIIHQYHALRLSKAPLSGLHAVSHAYPTYSEALVKRIADMDYIDELMSNSFVRLGLELLPGFRNNLKAVKKII